MYLEHNSQEEFYRRPTGALKNDSEVTLSLLISEIGIPHCVKCVMECGDKIEEIDMPYVFSISSNSIYSISFKPKEPSLFWYYFKVECDFGTIYYGNNRECLGGMGELYLDEKALNKFQITVYQKHFSTPSWFSKAIAYQIFPDRFYNGLETGEMLGNRRDIIKRNWGDTPFYKAEQFGGEYLSNDFFGGNLPGIIKKLPYLSDLGINTIYLNPIFKAFSNHKYDTGDYELIDEMFGDEEDFKSLCKAAHKLGIRIILDGVFNHTGSNSKYFNLLGEYDSVGAYQSKDSPYYDWYKFGKNHDEYECWWGMKTLPHVNEESKSFCDYILYNKNSIVKRWIGDGADGFRLDVVDELPDFFVQGLRKSIKEVNPDAVIIGEVWEDASNKVSYGEQREYFLGGELDGVMNYPLRSALIDAALNKIDSKQFNRRIMSIKENYPSPAFYSLLNIISGHDVERIITLMGDAPSKNSITRDAQAKYHLNEESFSLSKKRTLMIFGMLFTMPGAPCIFYGDEIAAEGYADPFCRSCFDWSKTKNNEFTNELKKWINLRKSSDTFSTGNFVPVYTIGSIYGYVREGDNEKYAVIVNFSNSFEKIRLDLGRFFMNKITNVFSDEKRSSKDGVYWVDMPEHMVKVFKFEER